MTTSTPPTATGKDVEMAKAHQEPASTKRKASVTEPTRSPVASGSSTTLPGGPNKENSKHTDKKPKLSVAKGGDEEKEAGVASGLIVELTKGGKWSVPKQKPLELYEVCNTVKKDVFNLTDELEALNSPPEFLTESQLITVARLAHESDKTLPELAKYIHSKLMPQSAFDEDDSQPSQASSDRLPLDLLKRGIESVVTRINYGIADAPSSDLSWLPTPVPNALKIFRWEANDRDAVFPKELKDKLGKRCLERQELPGLCIAGLQALSEEGRAEYLRKWNGGKGRKERGKLCENGVTGRDKERGDNIVKVDGQDVRLADGRVKGKTKVGAEDSGAREEKEAKRAEREEKKSEREAKVAEIAKKRAEKEAQKKARESVKNAKQAEVAKMGSFLSGWVTSGNGASSRRSSSPEPINKFAAPTTPSSAAGGKIGTVNLASSPVVAKSIESKKKRGDFERAFKPFNVKATVALAPLNRFRRRDTRNIPIGESSEITRDVCLRDFLQGIPEYRLPVGLRTLRPELTARDVVTKIAEAEMSGSVEECRRWRQLLDNPSVLKCKTLVFKEDTRPGYVGTWTKCSIIVRPRNPFGKDTSNLNYDYDSEAEWEEEGDGEELGGADEDDKSADEDDDEGELDDWLVGDDEVEMIDEEEPNDDVVFMGATAGSVAAHKAKEEEERRKKRKAAKEAGDAAAKRRKAVGPLVPVVKGPLWENQLGKNESAGLEQFRIQFINEAPIGLDPFTFASTPLYILLSDAGAISGTPHQTVGLSSSNGVPTEIDKTGLVPVTALTRKDNNQKVAGRASSGPFPTFLMPKLIKIVDGAKRTKPLLLEDLREAFANEEVKVTKVAIEKVLVDSTTREKGIWRVTDAVRATYSPGAPILA